MQEQLPPQMPPEQAANPMAAMREAFTNHPRIGKMVAAVALFHTIQSGGFIDQAASPFQDTEQVVHAAYETDSTPLEERTMDGIPFLEYPAAAQSEMRAEAQAEAEAPKRVALAMEDLDHGHIDDIYKRAEIFKHEQGANILSTEQKEQFTDLIDGAESREEVISALDSFMGFYGKKAGLQEEDRASIKKFDTSTDLESVRQVAKETVDALAYLPKQMVADASFDTLRLAGPSGLTKALYSGGTEAQIAVAVPSGVGGKAMNALNYLPNWLADENTIRGSILHELGHAKDPSVGYSDEVSSNTEVFKQVAKDIIGRPNSVSHYATTSVDEHRAETFAVAFNVQQGPTHPDETRRFSSQANKDVLADLAYAETEFPGITDYLVSLNPHLIRTH